MYYVAYDRACDALGTSNLGRPAYTLISGGRHIAHSPGTPLSLDLPPVALSICPRRPTLHQLQQACLHATRGLWKLP